MKKLMILMLAALVVLTPSCAKKSVSGRKKELSNMLSIRNDMTFNQVIARLGLPDKTLETYIDRNDNEVTVWEYNIQTCDRDKRTTKITFQVVGWLAFWPLLCFPQAWKSTWINETYYFKFINKQLTKWGKSVDIVDMEKEYAPAS